MGIDQPKMRHKIVMGRAPRLLRKRSEEPSMSESPVSLASKSMESSILAMLKPTKDPISVVPKPIENLKGLGLPLG